MEGYEIDFYSTTGGKSERPRETAGMSIPRTHIKTVHETIERTKKRPLPEGTIPNATTYKTTIDGSKAYIAIRNHEPRITLRAGTREDLETLALQLGLPRIEQTEIVSVRRDF